MGGSRPPAGPGRTEPSNLFFALFPAAGVATQLYKLAVDLRARHGLTGKAIAAERLHVTLHWLGAFGGEPPEEFVARAQQAAATVASPPIYLGFDEVRSFSGRPTRPFVLAMREENRVLDALHASLGAALVGAGIDNLAQEPYAPHMTLLRDKKPIAAQPITPVRWTAHELVLVRSLVGKGEYQRLGSWPFRPREVS